MIDPATFFRGFIIAFGIVLLLSGILFWIVFIIVKYRSSMKFWFKYKIFKRKYKEEDVQLIIDLTEADTTPEMLYATLLLKNKYMMSKIKELVYIYEQMIKIESKGGKK